MRVGRVVKISAKEEEGENKIVETKTRSKRLEIEGKERGSET